MFKQIFFIFTLIFLFAVPSAYAESTFKVIKVIDGDTIQVDVHGKKEVVRLLGIDTPESVDPRKSVQCFGKEATSKMKSFVAGKSVILVDDRSQGNRDKYKRLLRYVYLPDSVHTFVNGEMVKQGYAFSYRQYPTKMLDKFNNFERNAREKSLGLWGSCPVGGIAKKEAVKKNTYVAPVQAKTENATNGSSGGFSCSGKNTCGQMTSCAEAQFYLNSCGVSRLDADKDGVPCESLCK